jgi:type 1 fimbriae regulatory protein FimB/type 1 fimbriae regulatory protein FimE
MTDTPPPVFGTVPPKRVPNRDRRSREHLTPAEVDLLMKTAKANRHGHRDATAILTAYRHALRVSELCALKWEQIDFAHALLHVNRRKNGTPSTHPLRGDELRALRRLRRETPFSPYVFQSERGTPLSPAGFLKMLARLGAAAGLPFPVHPHMLRHGCGFKLANDGHDTRSIQHYMGHRNIHNTVKYTDMAAGRFKDFFGDA